MNTEGEVAVLDYGSQYSQLIVRRVRDLGYTSHLYAPEKLGSLNKPGAIILSGGPRSTSEENAPDVDHPKLMSFGVPVLGVCYGMQLLNIKYGGTVKPGRSAATTLVIFARWLSCSAMYLMDSGRFMMAASAMTIGATPPI